MSPAKVKLLSVLAFAFLSLTAWPQTRFFPANALSDDERGDKFRANWYSTQLKALEEPSLLEFAAKPSCESYRFLWLRTFHHPVAIRLDVRADGTGVLSTKVSSGAGGYGPGHLIENISRPVFREQVQALLRHLNKADYWSLPSYKETGGNDGAQWIIEGVKQGKYHVVDRWSPESGPIHELGLMMIRMAQMNIPKGDIY